MISDATVITNGLLSPFHPSCFQVLLRCCEELCRSCPRSVSRQYFSDQFPMHCPAECDYPTWQPADYSQSDRVEISGECRFRSSIGRTCAYPPPAAPPLIPKHGPRDGSRSAMIAFYSFLQMPSPQDLLSIVVFPSPCRGRIDWLSQEPVFHPCGLLLSPRVHRRASLCYFP